MDKCVVRQAIKDVQSEKVVGYELLFQQGKGDFYGETEVAVADTISSFMLANSDKIFHDKKIFITFTPALLFRNTPKIFEKDKVVIQIDCSLVVHPMTVPVIKQYYELGYRFAINDFEFNPKYFSILEYADYIRMQVGDTITDREKHSVEDMISMTRGFGKKFIATGVDSKEAYDNAVALGADLVEGTFVAESQITKANKTEYMQGNFFQLVVAVSKEEPDMAEVEEIVSRDAGLTYALLRLVNSAYFALRQRTASIRQALVTLGIGQMRQWVYMLSFRGDDFSSNEEVLKLSFLRAKFAEQLVVHVKNCGLSKSEAYMMGMFSTLEMMVDGSLEELIADIPINDEIRKALVTKEGPAGEILTLVYAYEKADWKTSKEIAERYAIPVPVLSQMYINCVEEVNTIWDSITQDFDRPEEEKSHKSDDGKDHIEDVLAK